MEALAEGLASLIRQDLVIEVNPVNPRDKRTSVCYDITPKGDNVLGYFNKARAILELEVSPRISY